MNVRRLIVSLYVLLLTGMGVGVGASILESRAQYRQLKQTELTNRLRLEEATTRLREQEKILARLRTERDFVEKVIRKRLGYAKPGEIIFRFED